MRLCVGGRLCTAGICVPVCGSRLCTVVVCVRGSPVYGVCLCLGIACVRDLCVCVCVGACVACVCGRAWGGVVGYRPWSHGLHRVCRYGHGPRGVGQCVCQSVGCWDRNSWTGVLPNIGPLGPQRLSPELRPVGQRSAVMFSGLQTHGGPRKTRKTVRLRFWGPKIWLSLFHSVDNSDWIWPSTVV